MELIEFQRYLDPSEVEETTNVLDEAGIKYHLVGPEDDFDLMSMGSDEEEPYIISVYQKDFDTAQQALEKSYEGSELPQDHYLQKASDLEIADMIATPSEWSPFDVYHAKKLGEEKGINEESIKEAEAKRLKRLKKGEPASGAMIGAMYLLSLGTPALVYFRTINYMVIAIVPIIMCWMILTSTKTTAESKYYQYNATSRDTAKRLFILNTLFSIYFVYLIIEAKMT